MSFHVRKTTSIPVVSAPDHLSGHLKLREEHNQMERDQAKQYLVETQQLFPCFSPPE